MTRLTIGRLPFVVALALVAGLCLLVLVLGAELQWGMRTYLLFVVPAAVAGWYIFEYDQRPLVVRDSSAPEVPSSPPDLNPPIPDLPMSPPPSAPAAEPPPTEELESDDEPFVDPVEEADRLDQERSRRAE